MKVELMKERVKAELSKMGYAKEADVLIAKYWNQVSCYSSARKKAEYMIS
jgi:hypothetical protein